MLHTFQCSMFTKKYIMTQFFSTIHHILHVLLMCIHHFEIDSPKLSCFTTNSFISSLMCPTKFKLHPWVDISIQVLKSAHALCKCNVECEVNKFDMKFYKTSFFSCLHRRLVIMLCCLIVYVGCHPRPLFCVRTNSNVITFMKPKQSRYTCVDNKLTTNILHGTLNVNVQM